MEIDLDDLEAKCRAATPGPWKSNQETCSIGEVCSVNQGGQAWFEICSEDLFHESNNYNDAAYIAALNPAVNLELIATTPDLLHLLATALPFVEDHEGSTVYKAGAVAALVKDIKAAIAKAEA